MTGPNSTIRRSDAQRVWDCVVIGGGPAGAMAAIQTARRGLKTLLVERKTFPRPKICGACVNVRALSVLKSCGVEDVCSELGGVPINRFLLRAQNRELELSLPGGVAVSRAAFDAALVRCAIDAGADFLPATSARVLPRMRRPSTRSLLLTDASSTAKSKDTTTEIAAQTVVAADGLGHPSLQALPEFSERVSPGSRIGLGATVADGRPFYQPGAIHMAVARGGYTGLVRIEDGRLNVAAAVDPKLLKSHGTPEAAVNAILREAGFAELPEQATHWSGTPALTRRIDCVASNRIFVVGDAAGYVEPFTGEGIAWALAGGATVAECALTSVRINAELAARRWQEQWQQLVCRRQKWCRRLAWLLRHPRTVRVAVSVASVCPRAALPIIKQLNSPFSVLNLSTQ